MSPSRRKSGSATLRRATRPARATPPAVPAGAPHADGVEPRPRIKREVSAGGVVYRRRRKRIEVVLVSAGKSPRWQLPKGLVEHGEKPEHSAVREVREEGGVEATLVAPLERVDYWYQRLDGGKRVRIRKFVHFFLLEYRRGDVRDHDEEVLDARWVELEKAGEMLAFASERKVLQEAARRLTSS